jgi:hypothetical protein
MRFARWISPLSGAADDACGFDSTGRVRAVRHQQGIALADTAASRESVDLL